jgi:hypothetical protein
VRDRDGQALTYVYSGAALGGSLSKDESRRIAANVARLRGPGNQRNHACARPITKHALLTWRISAMSFGDIDAAAINFGS